MSRPQLGSPSSASHLQSRRLRREQRVAAIYDTEILPIWSKRFGRMLLRGLVVPDKATILDVICGTGYPGLDILSRAGESVRLVAIDPSPVMLDAARKKAGARFGRRIFFRSESAEPSLPFDSDVFDLCISNLGLPDVAEPRQLLEEMVRVAKPGAQVRATLPLRGTFAEFYDLLEEVLEDRHMDEALRRLRAHMGTMPSAVEGKSWLVEAGLSEARVECEHFTLLFRGARDLFYAPVIEYGPLPGWKEVVGEGAAMQEVFRTIKDKIDRLTQTPIISSPGGPWGETATMPFSLTVRAGCLSGRKPVQGAE